MILDMGEITNTTHEITSAVNLTLKCNDCGAEIDSWDASTSTVTAAHNFENGNTCACGYTRSCSEDYHKSIAVKSREPERKKEYNWKNDYLYNYYDHITADTHTRVGKEVWRYTCDVCGESDTYRDDSCENYSIVEAHTLDDAGRCIYCGYVNRECTHKNRKRCSDLLYDYSRSNCVCTTAATHAYTNVTSYVKECCLDCGAQFDTVVEENLTIIDYHWYDNSEGDKNKCADCGYLSECDHKAEIIEGKDFYAHSFGYSNITEKTHDVYGDRHSYLYCSGCGDLVDDGDLEEGIMLTVEHEYINGMCVCGAVEPTQSATPEPTSAPDVTPTPSATVNADATPEPTMPAASDVPQATETPAASETPAMPAASDVPTAKATQPTATEAQQSKHEEDGMMKTLLTAVDALEKEGTSTRIVNLEKVLTDDEVEALEALPMREQLLTFLSVIGFEDQVNAALAADEAVLSPEAEALKAQIQARIQAMDETAYAEFESALMENFAQENIMIDGVDYTVFVLELEVRADGALRYERYGFRHEGDEWLFTRLENDA